MEPDPHGPHVGDPLERRHIEILLAMAVRTNGQANEIRECLPHVRRSDAELYCQALAELVATAHVLQIDKLAASTSGLPRFSLTSKGYAAITS